LIENKQKLTKQIEEYTILCQEHQTRMHKLNAEEEWLQKRQTEIDTLEERLLKRQKEQSDLDMHLSHKNHELEEINSNLKITQENITVQMDTLTQKERTVTMERDKIATLSGKLAQLEQDMESEHHTLKMELSRQKRENDRLQTLIQEKFEDLDNRERFLYKEREMLEKEKESIVQSVRAIEDKQQNVSKMS